MLTFDELLLINWYQCLESAERYAVDEWAKTGDDSLMLRLGLFDDDFHDAAQIATPKGSQESTL